MRESSQRSARIQLLLLIIAAILPAVTAQASMAAPVAVGVSEMPQLHDASAASSGRAEKYAALVPRTRIVRARTVKSCHAGSPLGKAAARVCDAVTIENLATVKASLVIHSAAFIDVCRAMPPPLLAASQAGTIPQQCKSRVPFFPPLSQRAICALSTPTKISTCNQS
jgi:hypothetical protein